MRNCTVASRQWATRPPEERFLSLHDLLNVTKQRWERSFQYVAEQAQVFADGETDNLRLQTEHSEHIFNSAGFSALCRMIGAPRTYLDTLPAKIVAPAVNYGLAHLKENGRRFSTYSYVPEENNNAGLLRSINGPDFGRLPDWRVVDSVIAATAETGIWTIPAASYTAKDPLRATTLYSSEDDLFIFLVDASRPIHEPGQDKPLYRGFYVRNSETGLSSLWAKSFLYRTVCDNRIVWGMTGEIELRVVHRKHAGDYFENFRYELAAQLRSYCESTAAPLEQAIAKAADKVLFAEPKKAAEWLAKRLPGVSAKKADKMVALAMGEGERWNTPWGLAQGVTAYARDHFETNNRVIYEKMAGDLLAGFSAN